MQNGTADVIMHRTKAKRWTKESFASLEKSKTIGCHCSFYTEHEPKNFLLVTEKEVAKMESFSFIFHLSVNENASFTFVYWDNWDRIIQETNHVDQHYQQVECWTILVFGCLISSGRAKERSWVRVYDRERERERARTTWRITNLIVFTHQVDLLRTCGLFPLVLHRPSHQKRDFWEAQALESDSTPEQSKS